MGRRSDHTRSELREMIVHEGHRQMTQVGFARFSATEVAKRIGCSIGTLYNVFGSYDGLILAINGRTLDLWRDQLREGLEAARGDRLRAAITAYFDFATRHRHSWAALYDFRLAEGEPTPEDYAAKMKAITQIVVEVVAQALPPTRQHQAEAAGALPPGHGA